MGTLDASIPLGVRPMQLDNPLDVQAKQMTLRQLLRQGQIQEMEMEKAQQAQDQERTLADLYRNNINPDGTINRHGILQGAASQGAGSRIPGLQKGFADEDKAKSDLGHVGAQTARLTGQTATDDYTRGRLKHDQGIRDILAMQSPDDARASLLRAVQNNEIDRDQGFQLHQQIPQDPGAFAQWKRSMLLRLMDAKAAYESTTPKFDKLDTNGSIDLGTIDPMTGLRTSNQVVPKVQSPDSVASNQRMAAEGLANRQNAVRVAGMPARTAGGDNKPPSGYRWGPDGTTQQAIPGGPADQAVKDANKRAVPMSVPLQKELLESDDAVQAAAAIVRSLKAAKDQNEKAYSGYFAKARATVMSNVAGGSASSDATIDIDNLMTGQALESLKLVFGGMPTEGERKILLDMQASVDKTPKQRQAIMDRAIAGAERRAKYASSKAKAIRAGSYLDGGIEPMEEETTPTSATGVPAEIAAILKKHGGE